jgi:hypothetical protein
MCVTVIFIALVLVLIAIIVFAVLVVLVFFISLGFVLFYFAFLYGRCILKQSRRGQHWHWRRIPSVINFTAISNSKSWASARRELPPDPNVCPLRTSLHSKIIPLFYLDWFLRVERRSEWTDV